MFYCMILKLFVEKKCSFVCKLRKSDIYVGMEAGAMPLLNIR